MSVEDVLLPHSPVRGNSEELNKALTQRDLRWFLQKVQIRRIQKMPLLYIYHHIYMMPRVMLLTARKTTTARSLVMMPLK